MVRPREDRMSEVRLNGDLRGDTELRRHVDHLRSLMQADEARDARGEIRINLGGLTDMNTRLLAALLALGREARRSGVKLSITAAPDFFRQYVEMTGVEGALRRACRYNPQVAGEAG